MTTFQQYLGAVRELLGRYRAVFALAWKDRKQSDTRGYSAAEAQFLPAVLAVQETPTPAAPRVFMWLLIAFAFLAVAWSVFGKIDIVAVASGKIVPSGYTKVVQPLGAAVVKASHVKKGDVLVMLEREQGQASLSDSRAKVAALKAALVRLHAEVLGRPLLFPPEVQAFPAFVSNQTELFQRRQRAVNQEAGHLLDHAEVVADKQAGKAVALLQLGQQRQHLGAHRDVEGRHRLVGDHKGRFAYQRPGNRHTLALAAREFMRIALRMPGLQPDFVQHLRHARLPLG